MRRLAVLLATGFGIGYLPIAPATWASAAAALALFALLPGMDWILIVVAIVAITPLAIWTSGEAERRLGHDARPIVIDEVVGMLVSVCGVPMAGRGSAHLAIMLAIAFVFFRVFDIWKPYPARSSQSLPGGYGVVVDDILAGVYANISLHIVARVWPA